MRYYTVLVQSAAYFGQEPLTYQHEAQLAGGTIVKVPMGRRVSLGVVISAVNKPAFTTKSINEIYDMLPPLPAELLRLSEWLHGYYPAPLGMVGQLLMPPALLDKHIASIEKQSQPQSALANLPPLTKEQQAVLVAITKPDTYILHGETGTGKTRVYLEQARKSLAAKQSVIVLIPEIGLTSQLEAVLRESFDSQVVVMHSQLTPVERQKAWLKILSSQQPLVVIGPRSALFAPLKHVGLIIVDEFHEPAYKQEQAPHYQAVRVASTLANLHKAVLLLGSATPPVVEYYLAQQKHKPILRMTQPARSTEKHSLQTSIIDLRERSNFSRSPYISDQLVAAIEQALSNGEQSLLYLNRRGSARLVLCNVCGWQALCPRCDLPLTYHADTHDLRCHTCGFTENTPTSCPQCDNPDIMFTSIGTKALASEISRLFPSAKVMRFDTDNKKAERFEQHYDAVKAGKVDILVGTQVLAKGLDLPSLSVLGVIVADTSLSLPDFSAQERTYQLLTQVLGRIGRGHRSGTAVIQSYQPTSPILAASVNRDWQTFYETEIEERQTFLFPPFCYLLQLTCRRASAKSAEAAAAKFAHELEMSGLHIRVQGPAPAFHERLNGKHQWQLIIKARDRSELLKVIDKLPKSGWFYDIDPVNLL